MADLKVKVLGESYNIPKGSTYADLANHVQSQFKDEIALAKVDGKLHELSKKINANEEVEFLTISSPDGRRAYRRSVCMVMHRSI
ncbi:MAG: TGS domain-containing protein, partial [Lachnospiraceae bacterium]|nr:TGS domain-containing protein [Lachnospiraceae bacterium]